jgi:hypothetical protein
VIELYEATARRLEHWRQADADIIQDQSAPKILEIAQIRWRPTIR